MYRFNVILYHTNGTQVKTSEQICVYFRRISVNETNEVHELQEIAALLIFAIIQFFFFMVLDVTELMANTRMCTLTSQAELIIPFERCDSLVKLISQFDTIHSKFNKAP